jgi:hypothetical protein
MEKQAQEKEKGNHACCTQCFTEFLQKSSNQLQRIYSLNPESTFAKRGIRK